MPLKVAAARQSSPTFPVSGPSLSHFVLDSWVAKTELIFVMGILCYNTKAAPGYAQRDARILRDITSHRTRERYVRNHYQYLGVIVTPPFVPPTPFLGQAVERYQCLFLSFFTPNSRMDMTSIFTTKLGPKLLFYHSIN